MTPKFRNFRLKNRIFAGGQKSKILVGHALSEHFRVFFRICRGPLAARSRPPMAGRWLQRKNSLFVFIIRVCYRILHCFSSLDFHVLAGK